MGLTQKQQEGLDITLERFKNKKPYTIIGGYAGTGKSYLVNAIVDAFGFSENEVAYACYTGKAALVLQNQGKNAMTLHRLLYKFYPDGYGGFRRRPVPVLDPQLKLIIVDEVSMCPKEMWELLLSHRRYVVGLGDPFQLPAIGAQQNLLDNPHIFLTEVMRQALDNDIIKYSMMLREGHNLSVGIQGENLKTLPKTAMNTGMLQWADQILCGTNATRKRINDNMRKLLGYEDIISENEKMICIKNYWDELSTDEEPLVNGMIGNLKYIYTEKSLKQIRGVFEVDNHRFNKFSLDYQLLKTGKPTIVMTDSGKVMPSPFKQLDYGYAITVHKAQGSQFNKVLVIDDYWKKGEDYRRWLYTAITRAVEKVVVLL